MVNVHVSFNRFIFVLQTADEKNGGCCSRLVLNASTEMESVVVLKLFASMIDWTKYAEPA